MSKGSPAPGGYGLFSFGSPLGTNPVAFRSNNTPPSFSISAWSPDINRASSPIGIDALSPQADDIVTLHRGNINSPIGVEQPSISSSPTARNSDSPPAHIINIFSPSGKSEALFKALGVSPTLGYSDGLLSEDEEDDDELNSFQLPPSALSEYDEFIEGMGGMDDLDSSEPSSYHHQHYTPAQPTGFETNGMLFNHASPNIGGTSPASSRLVSKSPLSCHVLSNSPVPAPLPNGDSPPNQYGEHPVGEHPSRTLFVRNINSNVEESDLRTMFETFGPLRSMYTQCKHRGFVMISYFDIRHAKNAMKNLQGKVLRRRKLDIHYSIPKDNPSEKDQNQGTLVVFNLDPSITSEELRVIFGNHGEIKEIRETPNKKHHKFIEFYDVRDAERAMKNLNKTEIKSKKIKIEPSRPGGRKSTYSPRSGDEASGMFMSGNGSSYESSGNFGYYEDDKSLSKSAPSQNHLEHLNSSSNVIHTSFSNTFSFLEHAPAELSSSGESFLFSPLSPTSNTSPSMIGSGLNNSSNNAIKDPRDQFAAPRRRPKAVSVMSPTLGSSPHSSGLTSSANNITNMVSSSGMSNNSINGGTGVAPRSPNWSSPSNSPVTSSHHRPLRSLSLPVSHQSPGGEEVGASVNISHSGGNINSSSIMSSSQASTHHNGNNNNTSSSNNSNNNNSMFSLSAFHSPPHGERDDASDSSLNDSELPSPRERKHRSKENDRSQFVLDIERVRNHIDVRTTLMIKNIPNKYTQKMLLTTVDDTQKGQYDFFYLPIDFKNKCNVGYAFINFIDPLSIISFYEKLHNTKWEKFNSEKVCDIAYARIQGKDSLINHFQNSSLMCEDKKCRPIIFHSNGPNIGQQAPFPVGPNVRMRSKDEKVFPARTEVRRHKDDSGNGVRPSGVKKNGKNARSRSYSYNK